MVQIPANDLFRRYMGAIVLLSGTDKKGDATCGAAFHIGDGYLVTARHVCDGMRDFKARFGIRDVEFAIEKVIHPSDSKVDLALLKTDFHQKIGPEPDEDATCRVPIGGHLDDWIDEGLVMTSVLLFGFPPIPFSNRAEMVCVRAEVNAVIDKYTGGHPHFIISALPRGGFSGGPVISEYDFLLGVMTESLTRDGKPTELGFAAAISIEPLWKLLSDNGIQIKNNRDPTSYSDEELRRMADKLPKVD
jgi:Trypsin-like peptidase domain